ncbi:putative glutathione transferase [Rosa chinensis]|uniref:Putative glutathione transferase n=1 Tax=Rosa chinensis TaxID=74649 RepID=A0A2P6PCB3_ROSCH|nr:putative glutathione transferase [Rosa chinensis]
MPRCVGFFGLSGLLLFRLRHSQRVRLALEEKGIGDTSFHLDPVTGRNMNASSQSNCNTPVTEWMDRIQQWNPKFFTLDHIPDKYFRSVSKFLRRVVMARMEESPDLAGAYHGKLQEVYGSMAQKTSGKTQKCFDTGKRTSNKTA